MNNIVNDQSGNSKSTTPLSRDLPAPFSLAHTRTERSESPIG